MTSENEAPLQDNGAANDSAFSMISQLREKEPDAVQLPAEPIPTKAVEEPKVEEPKPEIKPEPKPEPPKPEPVEEEPEESEEDAETRRNALLREIALDPRLTQQYVQNYQQPVYQQPQAQQPQQQFQPQVLPFDEFSFDPSNPSHQQALFDARLNEIGGPLFEKINWIAERFEREEQSKQQQQFQQMATQANQKTVQFLDTYVPGFAGITEKIGKGENLSAVERAVFNEAVNAESIYLQQYPNAVYDVQLRAQIAQQIGPELKRYAKELGLVAPAKAQTNPQTEARNG